MAKKGLVFIQNEYPKQNENFLYRQIYRFIPEFGKSIKTIVEVEIYKSNICVISFYEHNKGTEKNKYKLRSDIGPGHTRAIFKACLEAYYNLKEDFALVFSASNDVGKIDEDNSRYSAYLLFLSCYFNNYEDYDRQGSIAINTLMLYHRTFQYKDEADFFYTEFEKKVELNINDSGQYNDKP
ncbi:hypothetical protein K5L04_11680 [Flavobacterium psychrophilum]|uniref:hypothetical protein n=1 Tax=Flavobacterium psychrophilum TaxID=96345 RepID=UPI000B7C2847|nr:hypothetical protein [Flavobacterium psychrophilum]EKT4549377.1 hypothetical protein [Flavobacterium psychrophilum]ELI6454987.1 hypothetical protein [Flavobacterium psychrophilum]ELY1990915.1 hypothetical protein [Flavobacterium psychrophilum]MCB6087724.1 hypothetical protein [Flavobacterium psychrophilum]QZL00333.1 hypothetical protein K5L04_11680 [Flavobacterium psychrophilum]